MSSDPPSPEVSRLLMARLHKRAVFLESGLLALVLIEDVKVTPRLLKLRLDLLDAVTFSGAPRSSLRRNFTVSAVWEYMDVGGSLWSSSVQGCGWKIFASDLAFEAVCRVRQADLKPSEQFQLARSAAYRAAELQQSSIDITVELTALARAFKDEL